MIPWDKKCPNAFTDISARAACLLESNKRLPLIICVHEIIYVYVHLIQGLNMGPSHPAVLRIKSLHRESSVSFLRLATCNIPGESAEVAETRSWLVRGSTGGHWGRRSCSLVALGIRRPRRLLGHIWQCFVRAHIQPGNHKRRRSLVPVHLQSVCPPRLLLHALKFVQELVPFDSAVFPRLEPIGPVKGS